MIGEFFFKKYITNFNIIKHQSPKSIEAFNILTKIINKISRFQLFFEEIDCQYTLFNPYIMEICSKLNEFYDKLIDVSLTEKVPSQFTCIAFNIEMIVQLYSILKEYNEQFEYLPQGKLFSRCIGKMVYHIQKFEKKIKSSKEKIYLALFKYDADFIENIAEESVQLNHIVNNSVTIQDKVKFCIKIILRRLNFINSKLYSHLNLADSNKNFLLALNQVIQLEEKKQNSSDEDMGIIPLTWYALFMASHLDNDNESESDDYKKIYNDLLKEEENNLITLKEKYNNNAIRIGLFLQCAQNKIEKLKIVLRQKRKDSLNIIAQRVINEFTIPVCITKPDTSLNKRTSVQKRSIFFFSFKKNKDDEIETQSHSSSMNYFQVTPISQCIHQGMNLIKENKGNESIYHSNTIKQFAQQLSEFDEIQVDIKIGEQAYQILKIITQYLTIVHKKINKQLYLAPNETGFILELIEENVLHNIYKKYY